MREKVGEEDNLHFSIFPSVIHFLWPLETTLVFTPSQPLQLGSPPSSAPPQLIIYKNRNTQSSFKSSQQNIFE